MPRSGPAVPMRVSPRGVRSFLVGLSMLTLVAGLALGADPAGSAPVQARPPGTARSAAPAVDFNGDSFADLAVLGAGAVHVLYGASTGLTASGNQRFTRADMTAAPPAKNWGDISGLTLATGDFDADGFCDLAIGDDSAAVNGMREAGAVHVLYGSARGLSTSRSQYWTQNSPAVPGSVEPNDRFGVSLVAADFGRGNEADLAVGAPFEAVGSSDVAGTVTVLYGSRGGLTAAGSQILTQNSPGVPGRVESSDQFGRSLAAGDFDGSGQADLAVGVPMETIGRATVAGGVNIIYGSEQGLATAGGRFFSQATPGMVGRPESEDFFGYNLAAGHLAGQPYADLAVSVINKFGVRGAVHVMYGTAAGLSAQGNELLSYKTIDFPKQVRNPTIGDQLEIANFGWDSAGAEGYDDLAITVSSEDDLGEDVVFEAVFVLYGGSGGVNPAKSQLWSQDSRGVPGTSEGDGFGGALAGADFGRPAGQAHFADLAIGSPQESLGRFESAGRVHVLYGSTRGLTATNVQVWDQRGLGRTPADGSEFGLTLGASGP